MATIDFPLSIAQITKMRKDGDKVSSFFSYACIICLVLVLIFLLAYHLSSSKIFGIMSLISLVLASVFLLIVYIYRPHFLLSETKRRYKALDKLEGLAYEEALEKLTNEERNEYLDYETEKVARKAARQISK